MIVAPTVHLNGTDGDELLRQVDVAAEGMRKALAALYEMEPNARDYYPQGDDAFYAACRQFNDQIKAVRGVQTTISEIRVQIAAQVDARRRP